MALLVTPGTSVTLIDETFYIPAQATAVPVIFGVTADEKTYFDSTSQDDLPALGTYEFHKIRPITSIAQSIQLYGIPKFYTQTVGGTTYSLHGDSRNEYGLATLNYYLGLGSLAYFVRANVNTDDSRAKLLQLWDQKVSEAATRIQADATTFLTNYNNLHGTTRVSLSHTEVLPIVEDALNDVVFSSYSFRTKPQSPLTSDITLYSALANYPVGAYVYYNNVYYKALGANGPLSAVTPGTNDVVWQVQDMSWADTPSLFMNDVRTMPRGIFDSPSGFYGPADFTPGFIGMKGRMLEFVANTDGQTVGHADQFTPLEIRNLLLEISDDFTFTLEFNKSTVLASDDAGRRSAIVTALQAAVSATSDLRSDAYEFNIVMAPGFPELDDELDSLIQGTHEEAVGLSSTPMFLNPTDASSWANDPTPAPLPARIKSRNVIYHYGVAMISNLDGNDIVVPMSSVFLRTLTYSDTISYPWFAPAGVINGIISGVSRVGYLLSGTAGTPTTFVDAPLNQGERQLLLVGTAPTTPTNLNIVPYEFGAGYVVMSQVNSQPYVSEIMSINVDRLLRYIKRGIRKGSRPFLFRPNDQITRDQFKAMVDGFLSELVALRGLYDFASLCDESNNGPDRVARKELWCEVAVQPVTAVEFIYVPITVQKPS